MNQARQIQKRHCGTTPVGVITALLLIAVPVSSTQATKATQTCGRDSSDRAAETAQLLLDELLAANGVPGMSAAVWRDGAVAWTGCSGLRDIAAGLRVERDTVFRYASVSKVLAAAAVARLAEQNALDLDAPIAGMLPWLRNNWEPITVRQLAAHTSGLPHYQDIDDDRGRAHYPTARDAVGIFSGRRLLSRPGTTYAYSSWGYTLLGAVIEARSGTSFVEYVRERIVPGLNIQADGDGGANVSRLYEIGNDGPRVPAPHDFSYTWPGGGMAGTADAMVQFAGRLMHGEIVSPASWAAMQVPARLSDGKAVGERDVLVGLGWRSSRDFDGARIVHHAGVTEGARSALVLWPEGDTAVGVLSNALWISSIEQTAMLLAAPFRAEPDGLQRADCPLAARRYRGRLGERTFSGRAAFRLSGGRCVGELETDNALGEYFAKAATAWRGGTLRLVALQDDASFARAAVVTPIGLYDLRASGEGAWSAQLGQGRDLQVSVE